MCGDTSSITSCFLFWRAGDGVFKLNRNSTPRFFWGFMLLFFNFHVQEISLFSV